MPVNISEPDTTPGEEAHILRKAALAAKAGNRVLGIIAGLLILVMLLYGAYSLWDTAMVYAGAFLDDDLLQYKPTGEGEDNPTLEELMQINPDVRGWLTIDDTNIDYPVVQGETDMEYVNKDVYGEFALSGSIFLDSENSPDFTDSYSLVYGHHMSNGAMFGDVVEFVNEDYFEGHITGTLYLPDSTYEITLFACVEADASDSRIYSPQLQNSSTLDSFLSYIKEKSVQYRDVGVSPEDRIIGLSTCAEAVTNGRVVVFGLLNPRS
ncbi:SrtB family sortase [Lachnoclostridium sp. An169]|nr:SrtB family sortase [Lachnoclostridium sp. An169]HJA65567.1 class B sortase [Candidatus Mediterraneibacter cottocaccae]